MSKFFYDKTKISIVITHTINSLPTPAENLLT